MAEDVRFVIAQFSGSKDGAMAGTNTITGDLIRVPKGCTSWGFEALWSGSPTGTISIDRMLGVFPLDSGLTISDQPDGTTYAGDLDASTTNLEGEALGSSAVVTTDSAFDYVRPKYINTSGTGTLNVRFLFKFSV
jgi:hypothetical protein